MVVFGFDALVFDLLWCLKFFESLGWFFFLELLMSGEVKAVNCRICERETDKKGYCEVCDIATVESWLCAQCGFRSRAFFCENCGFAKAPPFTQPLATEETLFEEDDGTPTSGWKCDVCGRLNFEDKETGICGYPHDAATKAAIKEVWSWYDPISTLATFVVVLIGAAVIGGLIFIVVQAF